MLIGVVEGDGAAGAFIGPEVWKELKQSHNIQSISNGLPPGLEQDIEFSVFREGFGLFSESTTFLKHYRAIILADFGFARTEEDELEKAHPLSVFTMQVGSSVIKQLLRF